MSTPVFIEPEWDAPANIAAFTSTRTGGVSQGAYASLNLGDRCGDDPNAVAHNRRLLREHLALPAEPAWLWQVHGTQVADAHTAPPNPEADASFSTRAGVVCAVLTADCLPVLLCDAEGTRVAAAHCGWRGLAAGILAQTVARMSAKPDSLRAWLGPAIGPSAFEVGAEVRAQFVSRSADHAQAFVAGEPGKYFADIYALARRELAASGVHKVSGGDRCTLSEAGDFYSYRRDTICGRMASLIWISG